MNGNPAKIEIFAPFGAAYEWMKAMLFRPFDLARWLTIAFAAFLAGSLGGSGGGNLGSLGRFGDGGWGYGAPWPGDFSSGLQIQAWLIAGIGMVFLVDAINGGTSVW